MQSLITARALLIAFVAAAILSTACSPTHNRNSPHPDAAAPRFEVSFPASSRDTPLTGRLVVTLSKVADTDGDPPLILPISFSGPSLYAIDLHQLEPGQTAVVDHDALGYPLPLSEVPPGEYYAQARVNAYTQVHRADGHSIWVHTNDGTVAQSRFGSAEGDLYSNVHRVRLSQGGTVTLSLDNVVHAPTYPEDSDWYRHVKFQSPSLTRFWGYPVYIHARVLLPKGYADHPDTRYPAVYTLGHSWTPLSFREPDDGGSSRGSQSAHAPADSINPATGFDRDPYKMYEAWTSDDYPRFIAISLQQATPYFPDSYSVNSVNQGPYGDAVVQEMIPFLEGEFRIIDKPYARHVEGASTSGWQTLALLLRNPDFFGGGWVLQPDPIDFERYQLINIYEDTSAFAIPRGEFAASQRYFQRTVEGQPLVTVRELSLYEEVLGTKGRSGAQLGAWEAIYGPIGPDGYPVPLWDKLTGTLDRDVAHYMRDNGYDLLAYARENWRTLGPKLQGKLRFFVGDMDQYYLNLAVYSWEDFLAGTSSPRSDATFVYGRPMMGHSWHAWTWRQFGREVGAAIRADAPPGEDTSAWNYR
jgi:hypothetical protein